MTDRPSKVEITALADLLEPLHGERGEAADEKLMAYARWVAGKV